MNNANGTNARNEIKCYNCNIHVGHIARDCPEPKRAGRGEKKKESGMYVVMCEEIMEEVTTATTDVMNASTGTPSMHVVCSYNGRQVVRRPILRIK